MTVDAVSQPGDSGEHLHRGNIKVRAFSTPGRDDAIDLVRLGLGTGHSRILEVAGLE
jgi:hypothetical protein